MDSDERTLLLCTSEASICHWRIWYWAANPVMLVFFGVCGYFFFEERTLANALLGLAIFVVPAVALVVLMGFRTVIGLRVYEEGIDIITPLSDRSFAWSQVRAKQRFFDTYIFTPRGICPYTYLPLTRKGREALVLVRSRARK